MLKLNGEYVAFIVLLLLLLYAFEMLKKEGGTKKRE